MPNVLVPPAPRRRQHARVAVGLIGGDGGTRDFDRAAIVKATTLAAAASAAIAADAAIAAVADAAMAVAASAASAASAAFGVVGGDGGTWCS